MKKMKKLMAVILAAVMVLAMAIPVMATGADTAKTYTLRINSSDGSDEHKFEAYQIFSGTLGENGETLSDIDWGSGINTNTTVEDENGNHVNLLTAISRISLADGSTPFDEITADSTAADVANILQKYGDQSEVVKAFAEVVAQYLNTSTQVLAAENSKGTYVASDLSAGYYLVKDNAEDSDSFKASDLLLKLVGDVTIAAKVGTATVEKQAGVEGTDDNTAYGVGDEIPYTLTGTLPADYNSEVGHRYEFVDTMDKVLELVCKVDQNDQKKVTSGVTVKVDGTDVTDYFDIVKETNEDGKTVLTITCENLSGINGADITADSVITVSYKAILTKMPENGEGASNKVTLNYDTNSSTIEIVEKVFPLTLEVKKVDGTDANKFLAGAEFQLSRVDSNGGTETTYYLSKNDGTIEWSENEAAAVTLSTDANGSISVKGIPAGTYYLTEIKAPDGYNKLEKPVEVVIDASITTDQATGQQTLETLEITVDGNKKDGNKDTGTVTATITNNKGATLPSTGGIGTTIFYVIGGIIVAGAAIILVTRRRMNADR